MGNFCSSEANLPIDREDNTTSLVFEDPCKASEGLLFKSLQDSHEILKKKRKDALIVDEDQVRLEQSQTVHPYVAGLYALSGLGSLIVGSSCYAPAPSMPSVCCTELAKVIGHTQHIDADSDSNVEKLVLNPYGEPLTLPKVFAACAAHVPMDPNVSNGHNFELSNEKLGGGPHIVDQPLEDEPTMIKHAKTFISKTLLS